MTDERNVTVGEKVIAACSFCPENRGGGCKKVRVICPIYMNFKASEVGVKK